MTSTLTWKEHIKQICTKARKLVGMLYRKFSTWADTDTLRCLYLTCIRPHLEYACQLWDPYTTEGIHSLESVQKFACKVCLKQSNMDYDSMLKLLGIPLLATRRKYLKLTTMYNIVHNSYFFPPAIFVQHNFPYSSHHLNSNFIRPFARTQYLYSSFIPSVITAWNSLPYLTKHTLSISAFKRSLQDHFFLRLMCHISYMLFMLPCVTYNMNIIKNKNKQTLICFGKRSLLLRKIFMLTSLHALPRRRKVPRRLNDGSAPTLHKTVEDHYRVTYFEALDLITSCIEDRFNQPGYKTYANIQALLLKAAASEPYEEELRFVLSFYGPYSFQRIWKYSQKPFELTKEK